MHADTVLRLLEMAAGGFAVGYFNDTLTAPTLEGALPSLQTNHMLAKATDTASTGITAYVGGRLLDGVGMYRVSQAVEGGGYIYTAFKALTIPIDGAEAKLTTPSPLSLFRASLALIGGGGGLQSPSPVGMPAAAGAPMQLTTGQQGPNNTGYANPASGSSSVATSQASGYQFNTNGTFQSVPAPPSANLDWGL